MRRLIAHLKWALPAVLFLWGLWLYGYAPGRNFLGLICCGIACILSFFFLLTLPQLKKRCLIILIRRALSVLVIFGIVLYVATLIPILHTASGSADDACDYLVVLGAKVNGSSPSLILQDRIHAANTYLQTHPNTIAVLSGGQGQDENISEAQCMFNELVKLGIDPQRLWLEEKSTSTRENLNFSLALIAEKTGSTPDKLGVLSNEFHLYRAGMVARQCDVDATLIPAKTSWFSLKLNYLLREVPAIWFYYLLGG